MTTDPPVDRDTALRENRALWDEWTRVHETSAFYDLEGFKAGGIRLSDYEIDEIGSVAGLDLLHVQCHFGIDTLSWARLGARVTGADFSSAAVALARRVAVAIGQPDARFVESDVYDLPSNLAGDFDLVYTSKGVLGWLPDVRGWARVVAQFVRPGGRFYIADIHPIAQAFENEGVAPGELRLTYPLLGARRAAHVRDAGLVCGPERPARGRARARLGSLARRDRDRAHRRRARDPDPA